MADVGQLVETVSIAVTTAGAAQAPVFITEASELWAIDGIFTVTTNALDITTRQGVGSTSFSSGAQFGVRLLKLSEVKISASVAGANGTLTYFGTVVRGRENLERLLKAGLGVLG